MFERLQTSFILPKLIFGLMTGLILFAVGLAVAYVTMSPSVMFDETMKMTDSLTVIKNGG